MYACMCVSCAVCMFCAVLVLFVCLFCTMCEGHGGTSCGGPAARGRAEADCGLYTGKQPSKIQNDKKKHTGCDLDVCMMIMHVYPETHKKNTHHTFLASVSCFSFCHFLSLHSYHFPFFPL